MRFYVDKEADGWKWACALRGWGWAGYRVGDRHALLSGNPNRGIKKMKDILLRCAYMQTVKINDPILDGYLRAIQKNGLRFLAGYAPAVHLLAKRAEERGVELHLNGIVTFGETLTQPNRKTIEETFGCGVNDTYGLGGEALIVADQCEKRGCYHVHMENVVAERVDGEIVLTGLNNYAMPLIRYRTGDYAGEICSGCGCGRGLLSFNGITGRSGDVVVTASGAKLILEFFVVLFEKIPTVKQFQVLQDSVDGITLRIVRNSGFTDRDLNRIRGEIAMACDRELKVEFEFVDEIKSSGRGKRRLIISAIDDG